MGGGSVKTGSTYPMYEPSSSPSTSSSSSSSSSNYMIPLLSTLVKKDTSSSFSCGSSVDSVFGPVPTLIEVQYAIAAFQSFMQGLYSSKSTSDKLQPLWSQYYQTMSQSPDFLRVYDAFHMLQTVPSIQRMVASISTDKAVWEAVLNNCEVQEFRRSVKQVEVRKGQGSDEEVHMMSMVMRWILDNLKLKVVVLIDKLRSLVICSIESPRKENDNPTGLKHKLDEVIGSTVLLSIVTLMIVLVTRVYRA